MQECDCSSVTAGHLGTNDCVCERVCVPCINIGVIETHTGCKFNLKPPFLYKAAKR